MIILGLSILAQIIITSVGQLGNLKSQSSDIKNPSFIEYSLEDLESLLEMKFFANVSTSSILKSMDCHVNGNKD